MCLNPDFKESWSLSELENRVATETTFASEDVVAQLTGDLCIDYCLLTNCDSYHTELHVDFETGIEKHCIFSFFDAEYYSVQNAPGWDCYIRGGTLPVDCSLTSNCTPQLSTCGGTLPDSNFQKSDLLSCLPNAERFEFDSKTFVRKKHANNDFFYNGAEKTFMNG